MGVIIVETIFFLARVGQMADKSGPTLEQRKKLRQIGPLGQRKTSQPMELRKEPT